MADMHLPQGNNREVSGLEDSLLSLLVFLVFTTGGMGTWGCHGLLYKVFSPTEWDIHGGGVRRHIQESHTSCFS